MDKEKTTLLGIKRFLSKEGKPYATLQVMSPFRDEEVTQGCSGNKVEEVFVGDSLLANLGTLEIGKLIHLDYDVFGGRAYLTGFATVKDTGK